MSYDNPQSRNEAILQNILGADNVLEPPQSRTEAALTAILNGEEYTGEAKSRVEMLLKEISQQGGGNVDVEALAVDANGTYTAPEGTAYSPVTVNVSGGGGQEVPEKDVNFIDYDGTVLYSYTAQEALALTALPANPSHEGLTAQGWNYTLAEVKTEVNAVGGATVGQMYVTDDGKTRIYIEIPDGTPENRRDFSFRFAVTSGATATIDWGDGNTTTASATSATVYTHTYNASGEYMISLSISGGKIMYFFIMDTAGKIFKWFLKKIEMGAGLVYLSQRCFNACKKLQTVTMSEGEMAFENMAFYGCSSLQAFVVPPSVSNMANMFYMCRSLVRASLPPTLSSLGASAFNSCISLKSVCVPSTVTTISASAFSGCSTLAKAFMTNRITTFSGSMFASCPLLENAPIHQGVTVVDSSAFYGCESLTVVDIPEGVTTLQSSAFNSCYGLVKITIPASVTDIKSGALNGNSNLSEMHFLSTTPPNLASSFSGIPSDCKIYVPSASVETYKIATNWSSYASYIVGE